MTPARYVLLTALLLSGKAFAGQAVVCMDRAEMEASLIDWYQAERMPVTPVAGLEYWLAPQSGHWALLDHRPGGRSCVLARGRHKV